LGEEVFLSENSQVIVPLQDMKDKGNRNMGCFCSIIAKNGKSMSKVVRPFVNEGITFCCDQSREDLSSGTGFDIVTAEVGDAVNDCIDLEDGFDRLMKPVRGIQNNWRFESTDEWRGKAIKGPREGFLCENQVALSQDNFVIEFGKVREPGSELVRGCSELCATRGVQTGTDFTDDDISAQVRDGGPHASGLFIASRRSAAVRGRKSLGHG
jgi:hypothetical protein